MTRALVAAAALLALAALARAATPLTFRFTIPSTDCRNRGMTGSVVLCPRPLSRDPLLLIAQAPHDTCDQSLSPIPERMSFVSLFARQHCDTTLRLVYELPVAGREGQRDSIVVLNPPRDVTLYEVRTYDDANNWIRGPLYLWIPR